MPAAAVRTTLSTTLSPIFQIRIFLIRAFPVRTFLVAPMERNFIEIGTAMSEVFVSNALHPKAMVHHVKIYFSQSHDCTSSRGLFMTP